MAYHFLTPHIEELFEHGHMVELACTDLKGYDSLLKTKLHEIGNIPVRYIQLDRSPYCLSNMKGIRELKKIIDNGQYNLISTNEPVMSIATRLAARSSRKKGTKVVYTAHGFHFFKGSSMFSWLVYYPIERYMARYTDALITINKEDYVRAGNMKFAKVFYIPGIGFDSRLFTEAECNRTEYRKKLGAGNKDIVLISVGELSKRKNHAIAIRALAKCKSKNLLYIICGEGRLEWKLKKLCQKLGVKEKVKFMGYRKDIPLLCKAADIYVFPSQREGLGIGALEGMASGLPLVASGINGICDYAEDGKTGYCLSPHNSGSFAMAIDKLAQDPELREAMGNYSKTIARQFDISIVRNKLYQIYEKMIKEKQGNDS